MESAHEASQVVELQDLLEKQNYELAQMKERMSSLSSRVSEVEQELETARKDLSKSEEMSNKYQRDIREVRAYLGLRTHTHTLTHTQIRRQECQENIKGVGVCTGIHWCENTHTNTGDTHTHRHWMLRYMNAPG